MKTGASFDGIDLVRRHPFLACSILLHLALGAWLYFTGPYRLQLERQAHDQARVGAALDAARREQLQRHLGRLEQLARELGVEVPAPAGTPEDPQLRAAALASRIERADQRARAARLAELLKIAPDQALAQVKADDARRLRELPKLDAAHTVAQLEQRARAAAERMREQARRDANGRPVSPRQASAQPARPGGSLGGGGPAGAAGAGGAGGAGLGKGGGEATASIGGQGEPERVYDAMASGPTLDPGALRFAEGRSFGPGAAFANRVYLDNWHVVGPFAASSSRALDDVLGPELAVDLDALYAGRHGVVGWAPQQSPTYPFVPEPREPDAIYYASTEPRVDRDTEVWLDLGVDDDAKLWLNDELVWASTNADKPWYHRPFYRLDEELSRYGLVEGRVRVLLRAGRNRLLLKLYNGVDLMFFSVVVAR